jgi:hypothetical protein
MKVYMDDSRPGPSNIMINSSPMYNDWHEWIIVRGVENVKKLLSLGLVTDLALDHDMGIDPKSGVLLPDGSSLMRWMIETDTWPTGHITVHTDNGYKLKTMKEDIERHYYKRERQ